MATQTQKNTKQTLFVDPDVFGGVKRIAPMTRRQAAGTGSFSAVNPYRVRGGTWLSNCTACVLGYEMRMRGYPVEVAPAGPLADLLKKDVRQAFIDTNTRQMPELKLLADKTGKKAMICKTAKDFKQLEEGLKELLRPGERYTIQWNWVGFEGLGHIIMVMLNSVCNIVFLDPQTGQQYNGVDSFFKDYIAKDAPNGIQEIMVFQTSGMIINPKFSKVLQPVSIDPNDPRGGCSDEQLRILLNALRKASVNIKKQKRAA